MTGDTVLEALARRATDCPDTCAFVVDGKPMTFGELSAAATWLAGRLAHEGLRRGDRCAIVLPTSLEFVVAVFAAQLAGAAPVALDPTLRPLLRSSRLTMLRPALVVTTPGLAADMHGSRDPLAARVRTLTELRAGTARGLLEHRLDAGDVAYLQLTSGSMGDSRAAVITHRALLAGIEGLRDRFALSSNDVMAAWVPLHYAPGLVRYVFGTVQFGCQTHLIQPSAIELTRWLELLARTRATVTSAPDFAYRLAAKSAAAGNTTLGALRVATNGGERVRASTIDAFERAFGLSRVVQPSYGLAEATLVVTSRMPGEPVRSDSTGSVSCGRPLSGFEIRVIGPTGTVCAPGDQGEIQVRGDAVFAGYFDDPRQTAAVLRNGWLSTGDLGAIDEAGELFPRARVRALIKRAGAGLAPRDIEECAEALDDILGAAALGVPHPDRSTDDLVVIVETGADLQREGAALVRQVTQAIIHTIGMAPARVLVMPPASIPRTASGKILRADLHVLVEDDQFLRRAYGNN